MPLYEYRCKACGHRFEKIQSFSAPDEKECPVCHGEVERLISAPAVHFSGSGFYSTDYKAKSPSAPKPSEGGAAKEGSSGKSESTSSTGESATKPASTSEASSAPAAPSAPAPSGNK